MLLCLVCGGAAAGLCFATALWRLNAARSPGQAYRAAAVAAITAIAATVFLVASLAL